MPSAITTTTPTFELTALIKNNPDVRNWSLTYHNIFAIDAILNALHGAPRDGTVLISDPTEVPSLEIVSGGELYSGTTIYVRQSFIDEFGRETAASPSASILTNDPITNPTTPATVTVVEDTVGFDYGPMSIWYTLADAIGGETFPATAVVEYLSVKEPGFKNAVTVVLPTDSDGFGCDHVNVYIKFRNGNIVLAAITTTGSQTDVLIPVTPYDCYPLLPNSNTTNRSQAIEITGITAPSNAVTTRFYIKDIESDWVSGDYKLCLNSVTDFDVATVSYPLAYTGIADEKVAGIPREISAILPINADVTSTQDSEIAQLLGAPYVQSGLEITQLASPAMAVKSSTGWCISTERIWNPDADTSVAIAAAHSTLNRKDLVCVNTSGNVVSSSEDVLLKGTAATPASAPTTPEGYVLLATIQVDPAATAIHTADITDSRVIMERPGEVSADAYAALFNGAALPIEGLYISNSSPTPDMQVHVSAGYCIANRETRYSEAVAVTIATADVTNPRIDVVCSNPEGVIVSSADDALCKGVAAANPVAPSIYPWSSGGYLVIGSIYVAANVTEIIYTDITVGGPGGLVYPQWLGTPYIELLGCGYYTLQELLDDSATYDPYDLSDGSTVFVLNEGAFYTVTYLQMEDTYEWIKVANNFDMTNALGGAWTQGLEVSEQGIPDMNVFVSLGTCIIAEQAFITVPEYGTVWIDAADVANPRIDIVCVALYDPAYLAGEVVSSADDILCKGTAAGSPTAPATPTGYVLLAEIYVDANATAIHTADITDKRVGFWERAPIQPTGSTITDASEAHALNATFDDTEVEGALNNLGASINDILVALRTAGLIET